MSTDRSHPPSQLFTLRLWAEALGDDTQEVRGTVQHVVSGEARHFRDWPTLEAFLMDMLKAPVPPHAHPTNQESQEVDHGNPTGHDAR